MGCALLVPGESEYFSARYTAAQEPASAAPIATGDASREPPARPTLPTLPEADEVEDAFARWKAALVAGRDAFDAALALHAQAGDLLDKRAARLSPDRAERLFAALAEVDAYLVGELRGRGKFDVALAVQTRLAGWRKKFDGPTAPETIEAQAVVDDLAAIQRLPAKSLAALASAEKLDAQIAPALAEGDLDAALAAAERALAIRDPLLPADHLDRAGARTRLGLVRLSDDDFDGAIADLAAALAIQNKRLGEKHPAATETAIGLADAYAQSKRWAEAAPVYAAALEATKQYHGEDSVDYGLRLSQNAWGAWRAGELSLAAKLYNDASKRLRAELGDDSPELVSVLLEFGDVRCEQESYEEALPLFEEAVELTRDGHRRDTVDHAAALYRVGLCRDRLSDFAQAESLYREAIAILDGLAASDPETSDRELLGIVLENLGLLYEDMEEPERAEPLHRRAFELRKQHFGADDPDTIASQEALGLTLAAIDRFDEAEPLLQAALDARRVDSGPKSEDFASTAQLFGRELRKRGRLDQAAARLKESIAAWKASLGEKSPEYASAVFEFAETKRAQGEFSAALHWHRVAFVVRAEEHGGYHEETIESLRAVGELLLAREEFAEAEDSLQVALEGAELIHGAGAVETAGLLRSLGETYRAWGELGLAILYLEETATALDESTHRRGAEYAAVARELAGAYRELGAAASAKRWLGLADEAANAGVADDALVAERARILVERARFGLAFFPPDDASPARASALPPPTATPTALLDKAAALAEKLEKPDLALVAAIALARAKAAASSGTPAAALAAAQTAAERAGAAFGQDHTRFGEALFTLAQAHRRAGAPDEAEPLLLEAQTIVVERIGVESLAFAEIAEPLAAHWRATGRLADSIPLTLAAHKARYRAAETNLPHLADLGLQSLLVDRCRDLSGSLSPAALNLLEPRDERLAAECVRWSIALSSLSTELVGASRVLRDDSDLSAAGVVDRRTAATFLANERAGRLPAEQATSLDRLLERSPDAITRVVDDARPLPAAPEIAALRKLVSPTGVAIEVETVIELVPPKNDQPAGSVHRVVAWIVPGDFRRPVAFVELGDPSVLAADPTLPASPDPRGFNDRFDWQNKLIAGALAKLFARPEFAGATTVYAGGRFFSGGSPARFSTAERRILRATNLAGLINAIPDASADDAEAAGDDEAARAAASNDGTATTLPASELRRTTEPTAPPANRALPPVSGKRDKNASDATTTFPLPRTDDGRPRPASAGN